MKASQVTFNQILKKKKKKLKNCPKGKSYLSYYVSTIFLHLFLMVTYVDETYFQKLLVILYVNYFYASFFKHSICRLNLFFMLLGVLSR